MPAPFTTTLLDLVQSVSAVTTDDREVVATITALVNSGRVRLSGNFAGAKISFSAQPVNIVQRKVTPCW